MAKRQIAYRRYFSLSLLLISVLLAAGSAFAQGTAFSYQGKLTDAGTPATGNYDIQFLLFDTPDVGTGTQQGATITNSSVQVTSGIFTVQLDFGQGVFDGSARYLEIGVRPVDSKDPYTTLSPRQPITATPYSVRSMNAAAADGLSVACVNCITSSQIQSVQGAQISGAIPVESVPTGSGNYIQNAVAAARAGRPTVAQEGGFDLTGDGVLGGNLIVNGQAGIGTATPLAGITLDVAGAARISLPPDRAIQFGSPSSETGMSIQHSVGANRADVRFDGVTMKLVTIAGSGVPGSTNGIAIDTAGNVGIGTTPTPPAGIKLDVLGGAARIALTPSRAIQFGSPSSETGMSIQHAVGANRADVRFDGLTLKLVTIAGGGVPGSANGIAIDTSGNVGVGTTAPTARLHVVGTAKTSVLEITGGLDLAEHFDVVDGARPGMLVTIDRHNTGKLLIARGAYNRRVAGVISGANNLSAGMVLSNPAGGKISMPIALTGRVWVYCDASKNPIAPGDLLTTSTIAGHAMKVISYTRAQGAIIGKAMTRLKTGRGLVLVLVSLQ